MVSWRAERGQAAAEFAALLPLAALLLAGAWQLALVGHARWAAGSAAHAAARAGAVGGDVRAAARERLPSGLERGLRVRASGDGAVRVTLRIPPVLGMRVLGDVSATARFPDQG
jgi:hypothetical protein